jgi:S-adenosyl-L-methionine hydrolase (adenosine-forming)
MPKPIITLTTDFGLSDHYVGTMKGVILGICPQAQIVDLSHEVAEFAIPEGAYVISQAYRYFPKRTVHVVVIDPGVGSARRPIVAEAAGQFFVAPDNGVLGMIYAREKSKVRALTSDRYFLKPVSRTFHGRDIFAPTGAHLAAGANPAEFGKRIGDFVQGDFAKPERSGDQTWKGRILRIDHFGNIITNFLASDFPGLAKGNFLLTAGPRRVSAMGHSYAEAKPGELFVIEGSGGYLEISLNQGSAARVTGCSAGDSVVLSFGPQ